MQCRTGPAPAGDYATFLLHAFLRAGFETYTAPVEEGPGPVQDMPGQFEDCPGQLPASLTVDSLGALNRNSAVFVRFLRWLERTHGVKRIWLVAHSMGGLVARGAIARLVRDGKGAPRVLGLFTLGTPHIGSIVADVSVSQVGTEACRGQTLCNAVTGVLRADPSGYQPALGQNSHAFLEHWNPAFGRVPRSIPVTAYAGDVEQAPGPDDPYAWPNDAYVGVASALPAELKRSGVLPSLRCAPLTHDIHSLFIQGVSRTLLGEAPQAIVDDPAVATSIVAAIRGHFPPSGC